MVTGSRRWLHTAQPWLVRRDFQYAADWLSSLQDASGTELAPSTWASEVTEAVRARWQGHPLLAPALSKLEWAAERLDGCRVQQTAVHGDFWHGNILVDDDRAVVSGVLNWTAGQTEGCPLRDLTRFALRYSQLLDPDTHAASRAAGRVGLRSAGRTAGVRLVPLGSGWYPRPVRTYLCDGLARLGVPEERWFDVVLTGIAEIAAEDDDAHNAEDHLETLSCLPPRPGLRQGVRRA
jgi:hypothetical protein